MKKPQGERSHEEMVEWHSAQLIHHARQVRSGVRRKSRIRTLIDRKKASELAKE